MVRVIYGLWLKNKIEFFAISIKPIKKIIFNGVGFKF